MKFKTGNCRTLALALLMLVCGGLRGQDLPRAESVADPARVTVGDLISYRITVLGAAGSQIQFTPPGETLGPFEVRRFRVLDPVENAEEKTFVAEATLSIFQTGKFQIPSPEVLYRPPDGGPTIPVSVPEAEITVESVMPAEASDILDIKPPLEIPRAWWSYWPWGLAAALLGAAVYAILRLRRPKLGVEPLRPRLSPYAEAYQALCRLRDQGPPGRNEVKSHYTELSDVARRYLQGRFSIPAMEMTSAEIRSRLARVDIEDQTRDVVDRLLARCDLVKFAKHMPTAEGSRAALEDAFEILERTRPQEPKPSALPAAAPVAAD